MPNTFKLPDPPESTNITGTILNPISTGTELKIKSPQSPVDPNIPTIPQPGHLLEPEFAPHYYKWKADPSKSNTDALLKLGRPIITKALRTHTSADSRESPTMMVKAKLMFLKALKNYDPTKAKLNTYMMSQLHGLRRTSVEEERIIKIPEQRLLESLRLKDEEDRFKDEHDYTPSDEELANRMGISLKKIEQIREARKRFNPISPTIFEKDDGSDETSSFDPAITSGPRSREWQELVWRDLAPKSPTRNPGGVSDGQFILQHTFGLYGHDTLKNQEIAKRLGVTASAVSQQKIKLQKLLDRQHDVEDD